MTTLELFVVISIPIVILGIGAFKLGQLYEAMKHLYDKQEKEIDELLLE